MQNNFFSGQNYQKFFYLYCYNSFCLHDEGISELFNPF